MPTLQEYLKLRNGTDVRGVAVEGVENEPVTLTKEVVKQIAKAFVFWLGAKTGKAKLRIAVGYDSRISAPVLSAAFLDGITELGCDAIATGLSTTPSMFMLLKDEKRRGQGAIDGSVMITASHLPFNRNGLKFFTENGGLEGSEVKEILTLAGEKEFPTQTKKGSITFAPYLDEYAASLVALVRRETGEEKPLLGKKILVDAGNGAGGFYVEKVLKPLGADTEGSQFLTPDGSFPNHIPNPENAEAMHSVCEAVKAQDADFGIIFDTDVDRAGAVDKGGEEINRNRLIALISALLLREKRGTIVTDSVTSDGLAQFIEDCGGKHHRFKRGYKNVINEAIRLNGLGEYAPLAIETSGHAALQENYFLDDGAYLVTKLLIALANESKAGRHLTDLIADMPLPEEAKEARVKFRADCDFKTLGVGVIEDFKTYVQSVPFATPTKENHEGYRVNFDENNGDGWALMRMSLHDPILPINAESESEGGVKKILLFLYDFLKAYDFLDLAPLEKAIATCSDEPTQPKPKKQKVKNKQAGETQMNVQKTTINALRILSAEAIEKAKSGHPGLPMGCAPIAYTLFQNFLKFNPKDAKWDDRDRFVLSAGHGSMLYYSLLYLYGYGLTKDDLMNFRQLGSMTPGHPEYGHTVGIETTTGPLGQGIANAVGMAMAEANLAAKFNKPGFPVVDHYTYAICGDGCLEEGISYEACSFAGTHKLGKLILLYDDNEITIEGDTDSTFKEHVGARFAAQNWQVLHVDLATRPDDVESLAAAIEKAKARTDKPSIIICKTRIGYGSPLEGSEKSHGAPLGAANVEASKKKLGWPCEEAFDCPEEVFEHCAVAAKAGAEQETAWKKMMIDYEANYPELAKAYKEAMEGKLPDFDQIEGLYDFEKPMATRQTSAKVLNQLAKEIPTLIGGSADLAPSNLTTMKDTDEITYGDFTPENFAGRNIHFGIREHAMAAMVNGMQLHGGLNAYCATFFVFADYAKPAMRLSALMKLPVVYVMTHDSIGVGEDGPTHQPIEQLVMLRSIPGMKVYRPADGKETAAAWVSALTGNAPTTLVLTRQALPQYEGSGKQAMQGGYVLEDCDGTPDVILMGSGSEIELCVKAKAMLETQGIKARVVSMPCMEEFEKQSAEYKESVLPKSVKARVCVEAASPYSWYKYAGDCGELVCMNSFGASAPAGKLFPHFGFTAENVTAKALASIENTK
ncbi:MAG: transketolase [Clostridia bacterium]|nr:transketolase [Clostridia bacterium]